MRTGPDLWLALAMTAGTGLAAATEPTPAPARTEAPATAAAQSATAPVRDPVGFESALANYRPYRADEPLEDWRAANAAVGRTGDHAGHQPAAPEADRMHHGEHGQ